MLFGVVSQCSRAENQSYPKLQPPPSPPLANCPSAPSHDLFDFLNKVPKYRYMHLFSQDSNIWSDVHYPTPPPLKPAQYFWSSLTPHQPLFVFCYNQLQHLSCIFIFYHCYPSLTIYPIKMTWNPWKHTSLTSIFNSFERIRSVPQESGGPYLKETQTESKPETCSGERDPFTFVW